MAASCSVKGTTDGYTGRPTNLPPNLLRSSLMFQNLDTPTVDPLLQAATRFTYPSGAFIAHQGEPVTHVTFVESGLAVLLDLSEDGDTMILGWLQQGCTSGLESSFFPTSCNQLAVKATVETQALRWRVGTFRQIANDHPTLNKNALHTNAGSNDTHP